MTDEERAFIRGIAEAPEKDDVPRLAFADWLEERGRLERADFIRVQVGRLYAPSDLPPADELWHRETHYLAHFVAGWRAEELPEVPRANWGGFRRGFVRTATFGDPAALLEAADEVFARVPLESVTVEGASGEQAVTLLRGPWLTGVRRLSFTPPSSEWRNRQARAFGEEVAQAMLESPAAARLSWLWAIWDRTLSAPMRRRLEQRFGGTLHGQADTLEGPGQNSRYG